MGIDLPGELEVDLAGTDFEKINEEKKIYLEEVKEQGKAFYKEVKDHKKFSLCFVPVKDKVVLKILDFNSSIKHTFDPKPVRKRELKRKK
jgi:hypothetical protein